MVLFTLEAMTAVGKQTTADVGSMQNNKCTKRHSSNCKVAKVIYACHWYRCSLDAPHGNHSVDSASSFSQMEFAIGYLQRIIFSLLIVMNCGMQISIRDCGEAIQLRPKTRSLISAKSLIMQMTPNK